MKIKDYDPSQQLQPFIKCYRIIEGEEQTINRVLPGTSVAISFRLHGHIKYTTSIGNQNLPTVTLSGLRRSVRLINYDQGASSLIVLFKECGASAFFREPVHALFEKTVSLDSLIHPRELELIEEQLSEAINHSKRISIVEHFLLSKMRSFDGDKIVSIAIEKIKSTGGIIRIKELADALCISTDAFEKRFRKVVGASPKQFASIIRMSVIVDQVKHRPNVLEAALDAGFYDQSHFIKTFKTFTGQTPTEFSRIASHW